MSIYEPDLEKKRSQKITEIAAVVGIIISVIVAVTTLFNSANLPLWWFILSVISLISLTILTLSLLFIAFSRPLTEKLKARRDESKRKAIVGKYAREFEDLTNRAWSFESTIENFFRILNELYKTKITSMLCSHIMVSFKQNQTESSFRKIRQGIEKSKTYHEFALIAEHFEVVLNTYQRSLKEIEVFVNDLTVQGEKMPKGIVDDFEAFREKYNYFLKDVNDFSHKINQQTNRNDFPEHLEYLKKW